MSCARANCRKFVFPTGMERADGSGSAPATITADAPLSLKCKAGYSDNSQTAELTCDGATLLVNTNFECTEISCNAYTLKPGEICTSHPETWTDSPLVLTAVSDPQASMACEAGYTASGSVTVTCGIVGGDVTKTLVCTKNTCAAFDLDAENMVGVASTEAGAPAACGAARLSAGSECTATCKAGWRASLSDPDRQALVVCDSRAADGAPAETRLQCTQNVCAPFSKPTPSNPSIDYTDCDGVMKSGATCTLTCKQYYTHADGSGDLTLTCAQDAEYGDKLEGVGGALTCEYKQDAGYTVEGSIILEGFTGKEVSAAELVQVRQAFADSANVPAAAVGLSRAPAAPAAEYMYTVHSTKAGKAALDATMADGKAFKTGFQAALTAQGLTGITLSSVTVGAAATISAAQRAAVAATAVLAAAAAMATQ